jgi:hypothetical protein
MEVDSMSQLEKKRERENKISKLMGEYLLKGYKMLGSTCNVCGVSTLRNFGQLFVKEIKSPPSPSAGPVYMEASYPARRVTPQRRDPGCYRN